MSITGVVAKVIVSGFKTINIDEDQGEDGLRALSSSNISLQFEEARGLARHSREFVN
jgi:hypothetical protein